MLRLRNVVMAAVMGVVACELAAQNVASERPSAVPDSGHSPYVGRRVDDPEGLSGLWEVSNGRGGAVGIHLMLTTSVAPDAKADGKTLAGVEQLWENLEVGVYERQGQVLAFGEENSFSDTPGGASVKLEDGRLQLHFVCQWPSDPSIDLDLVKQPGDRWVGRLHRGSFDGKVTLERPGTDVKTSNVIVGTWGAGNPLNGCMHIAEEALAVFTGWSDSLQVPGEMECAPSARQQRLMELYGELMTVKVRADDNVSFEFDAYNPMCCSHTFIGRPGVDGKMIEGRWPTDLNQTFHDESWKKMDHNSCVRSDKVQTKEQRGG